MTTPEPVVIVEYSPDWAPQFEQIRALLLTTLGELALAVEHVGSTAVPGLAAKPIIDIDVVIARLDDIDAVKTALTAIGYAYSGEQGIAGRHAFKQPADLPRHHCYVCAKDSAELLRHLSFRDALRHDPRLAANYAALKQELPATFRDDRLGYSEAKTAFVEAALRRH
jgi:GrpB-like predicted nucleotidyltransferase (UPF0157 family)